MIGVSALVSWSSYITETSFQVPMICCASLDMMVEPCCIDWVRASAGTNGERVRQHISRSSPRKRGPRATRQNLDWIESDLPADHHRLAADEARKMLEP